MRLKDETSALSPLIWLLGLAGLGLGGGIVFAIAPQMMIIYLLFAAFFLMGLVALKSGPKVLKSLVPVFILIVIVVLLFSFIKLPFTITPPNFSTEMKSRDIEAWRGEGNPAWEIPKSDNGELIDSIRYITTYKPEGKSEKVVMQGRICKLSGISWGPWNGVYRYYWYHYDGTSWVEDGYFEGEEDVDIWAINDCRNLQAYVTQELETGYSGFLKVELQIFFDHIIGEDYWRIMAYDMAYVKEGKVTGSWSKTRYEVGETATFHWTTGYCSSSKAENPETGGCVLEIYSPGQAKVVHRETLPQNEQGSAEYKVVMADFKTGGDCQNMLVATIFNDLVEIYEEYTTVIDFSELGPSKPKISTNKPNYNVGDEIEIEIEAKPNSKTQLPIEKYHIRIYYTNPQVVMEDRWITSNTFIFSGTTEKGTLAIEVFCQDEGCRPSEINTKFVKIYDPNDPRGGLPIPWLVIILELVMVIVGVFIMLYARPLPAIIRIIIFIILLLIPPALWWMGVIY